MAEAVASHLVKVDPGTPGWWISLAYALRRTESVEKEEVILLRARAIHPKVAMIAFNLACYAMLCPAAANRSDWPAQNFSEFLANSIRRLASSLLLCLSARSRSHFRPERCARAQQGRQWLMVGRESRRCWTGPPLSVGCSNPREGQTALRRRTRLFYPGRENEAKVTLY